MITIKTVTGRTVEATVSRPWALTWWPVVRGLERGYGAMEGVLSPLAAWNRYLTPLPTQLFRRILSIYPLYSKLKCLRPPTCSISISIRHDLFCSSWRKRQFLSWLLYKLLSLFYQLKSNISYLCIGMWIIINEIIN